MKYSPNDKNHILIEKKFSVLTEKGIKKVEVRKTSKEYTNGIKYYFDNKTFKYLLTVIWCKRREAFPKPLSKILDKESYEWVLKNYISEHIQFDLFDIEPENKEDICDKQ